MRARTGSRVAMRSLAALVVFTMTTPVCAATLEETAKPLRKLSRGLANSVAGILALPVTMTQVGQEEGPVAGMSWGLFLGLGAAITRTLVGVAEVLTFPFPLPAVGYGPLIKPEFLLQPENP